MMKPIYLDYAATTPVDPQVAEKMYACLTQEGVFGNPSSRHVYGSAARDAVEIARYQVAQLIGALASEIIWTSGATEANNLAIKGAVKLYQRRGKHIVTMQTEHKAVLDVCQHLEKNGYALTYLKPQPNGLLDLDEFRVALRDDTVLASIMYVNNETGVVQPMNEIAAITSERGILLHVDAAQAPGKLQIDLKQTPIDLLSLASHKAYGPKGIGALYLRKKPRVRVEPLIHGGGHEQGMRSGTLPTHQIVGMGEAFAIAETVKDTEIKRITELRQRFLQGLKIIPTIKFNTDLTHTVPHILSLRFEGMVADAILDQLPTIAASTASACQGKGTEGSYVLRAMGFAESEIKGAIRFSFGRFTTQQDITLALQSIQKLFV